MNLWHKRKISRGAGLDMEGRLKKPKLFKKYRKEMKARAEEVFKEICQIEPKFKKLLNIDIVKEAILTAWAYGVYEGIKQAGNEKK